VEISKLEKLMHFQEFEMKQDILQNVNIDFEKFYSQKFPGGVLRVSVLIKKNKSQENW